MLSEKYNLMVYQARLISRRVQLEYQSKKHDLMVPVFLKMIVRNMKGKWQNQREIGQELLLRSVHC